MRLNRLVIGTEEHPQCEGGATLSVENIPDNNPYPSVLIRLAWTTQIVGTDVRNLTASYGATKHDYYIDIASLQPANTVRRWLATSMSDEVASGGTVESANDFKAVNVAQKIYIISSTGTASSMDCWVTRNGSAISSTILSFTPGTTAAGTLLSSGTQTTGSSSASDTYGAACTYNGNFITGPFGATIAFTTQVVLTP
jgi:hypothetical protein